VHFINNNQCLKTTKIPDLLSESHQIKDGNSNNLFFNYQYNYINSFNEENSLKLINDNTIFNRDYLEPNRKLDEKYLEIFFDNRNVSEIEQEQQYKFEINDEYNLNIKNLYTSSIENFPFIENEKVDTDFFFLNI
jgi:hypothetical protein